MHFTQSCTNKQTQSTHRKSRLEPAIRDAQKLAQNVFPPWSPKPIAFLSFPLPSPLSLHKLPIKIFDKSYTFFLLGEKEHRRKSHAIFRHFIDASFRHSQWKEIMTGNQTMNETSMKDVQYQHFYSRQQVWEWLKCFRKPWFLCTVFVFSFVLFSRLLEFIKDGRASKQEFSQLSLLYTGNHYDCLFKTYATPRNLFTYRLADLPFQLTFKIIVSLSLPPQYGIQLLSSFYFCFPNLNCLIFGFSSRKVSQRDYRWLRL